MFVVNITCLLLGALISGNLPCKAWTNPVFSRRDDPIHLERVTRECDWAKNWRVQVLRGKGFWHWIRPCNVYCIRGIYDSASTTAHSLQNRNHDEHEIHTKWGNGKIYFIAFPKLMTKHNSDPGNESQCSLMSMLHYRVKAVCMATWRGNIYSATNRKIHRSNIILQSKSGSVRANVSPIAESNSIRTDARVSQSNTSWQGNTVQPEAANTPNRSGVCRVFAPPSYSPRC